MPLPRAPRGSRGVGAEWGSRIRSGRFSARCPRKPAVWQSLQIPTATRPRWVSMTLGPWSGLKYQPSKKGSDALRTRPSSAPSGPKSEKVL